MKLSSFLDESLVFWNTSFEDRDQLYTFLADKIGLEYKLSKKDIYDVFWKRDKMGTLLLSENVAIPHGRLENFDDLIISIVKNSTPIDFGNGSANYLFVILTGKSGSNSYLKSLASFAELTDNFRTQFDSITDSLGFIKFIENNDITLSEPVRVSEVMTKQPIVAHLDDTISHIADVMRDNNIIYLPVVDNENRYLGKIDILDIVKLGFPEYALALNDISFLSSLRAYEEYEKEERIKKVSDIYIQDLKKTIASNNTIIGLGYAFLKNKWHHVAVLDDQNKVVGIITSRTLLHNIVRV